MDAAKQTTPVLQLKASLHPFTVLQLENLDTAAIVADLQQRLAKAPELLKNAPVVIELPNQPIALDWIEDLLVELKTLSFIPVGLRCQQDQHALAEHLNLPIFNDSSKPQKAKAIEKSPAKLIKQAVRSAASH